MKNSNELVQLLSLTKAVPTEISIDDMEVFISKIDAIEYSSWDKHNWKKFINPKNIIMLSISIAIFIATIFSFENLNKAQTIKLDNKTEVLIESNINEDNLVEEKESILHSQAKKETTDISTYVESEKIAIKTKTQITATPDESSVIALENKSLIKRKTIPLIKEEDSAQELYKPKKQNKLEYKSILEPSPEYWSLPIEAGSTASKPMNNLSDGELRRLKRKLYKSLVSDGLISSKGEYVELILKEDRFLVNEYELNETKAKSYRLLTQKIGYGPDRKIQLDRAFIKVGDFTDEGFSGIGLGTFYEEYKDQKSEDLFSTSNCKKLLRKQRKALDDLSYELYDRNANYGLRGLFGISMESEKCEEFQQDLLDLLEEDDFDNLYQFIIIQFPSDQIYINGVLLNEIKRLKYQSVIDKFKIKPRVNRMIRISPNLFEIGDYSEGKFTGTMYAKCDNNF